MPLNELPMRVNRAAYREYCRNPDLTDDEFRLLLSKSIFGAENPAAAEDLLFVTDCCFKESQWFKPPPLFTGPEGQQAEKVAVLRKRVDRLRSIAGRYEKSTMEAERDLHKIATWIVQRWN